MSYLENIDSEDRPMVLCGISQCGRLKPYPKHDIALHPSWTPKYGELWTFGLQQYVELWTFGLQQYVELWTFGLQTYVELWTFGLVLDAQGCCFTYFLRVQVRKIAMHGIWCGSSALYSR